MWRSLLGDFQSIRVNQSATSPRELPKRRNVLAASGDFGGDARIPQAQLRSANKPVLELPAVLIGIVAVYSPSCFQGKYH